LKSDFINSVFFVFLGMFFLFLSNVGFNIFSARFLGPVLYGEFNSFFYLLLAFSQPNNALQLFVAKEVSKEGRDKIKDILFSIFVMGIFLFLILSLVMYFLLGFYNIKGIFYLVFGSLIVGLWFVLSGVRGIFQGRLDFLTYGLNIGFEGIFRMFFALVFFLLGLKISGAVLSSVFGAFLALLFLFFNNKIEIEFDGLNFNFSFLKNFLYAFFFFLPFGLIFQLDLSFSQYFIGGEENGYITACSLYGKNLVLLSMVLANVVFSYVLKKSEGYFIIGSLITSVLFMVAFVFSLLFGRWLIVFVQGKDFVNAGKFLPLYILVSFPLGILQQIMNYIYAKEIKFFPFFMWGLFFVFFTSLLFLFKSFVFSVNQFLFVFLIAFLLIDILLASFIFLYNKKLLLTKSLK
jgi:O-antigen/teichoic acid export membrane protein